MYCARHITHEIESDDSKSKQLGRAFHAACTNPEYFSDHYAIIPNVMEDGTDINKRMPSHREWLADREAEAIAADKDWVSADQVEPIKRMIESVMDNPATSRYLIRDGGVEKAVISQDRETGQDIKALVDLDLGSIIVDLKTTRRSTVGWFADDSVKFGYDYQAAHYLDVTEADQFIIIGVRNEPPYEAMAYSVPAEDIKVARDKNHETLRKIKECHDLGSWHSLGWGELNLLRRDK